MRRLARPDRIAVVVVGALALIARLALALWGFRRFPPLADGTFYELYGRRIAEGKGYTHELDGAIVYASHYPVGYPALVALAYRVGPAEPGSVMVLNALVGALGVVALHLAAVRLFGARGRVPSGAHLGALVLALHPGLVSYIPALMTEGLTAALYGGLIALAAWAHDPEGPPRRAPLVALGVALGAVALIRPQALLLAPLFGGALLVASGVGRGARGLARGALPLALIAGSALVVVTPWTARNCARVGRCALVSTNGGWNLLIGTDAEASGTWAPVKVPPACAEVWDEGEKDACFGREATRAIADDPVGWLALAPKKLSATFDYIGSGPWYLHTGNPDVFSYRDKVRWAVVEIAINRALTALGIVGVARRTGWLARRGWAASIALAASVLLPWGWVSVLLLAVLAALAARQLAASAELGARSAALAFGLAGATILATAGVHVLFFGSGRYGLVILPALCLLLGDLDLRRGGPAPPSRAF